MFKRPTLAMSAFCIGASVVWNGALLGSQKPIIPPQVVRYAACLTELLKENIRMPAVLYDIIVGYSRVTPTGYALKQVVLMGGEEDEKASLSYENNVAVINSNSGEYSHSNFMSLSSCAENQLVAMYNMTCRKGFIWDVKNKTVERIAELPNQELDVLEISSRGSFLVFSYTQHNVKTVGLLNLHNKGVVSLLGLSPGFSLKDRIRFTSDDSHVIALNDGYNEIIGWDLASLPQHLQPTLHIPLKKNFLDDFRISFDKTLLVARYRNGVVSVWKNPLENVADRVSVDIETEDDEVRTKLCFLSPYNELVIHNENSSDVYMYAIQREPLSLEKIDSNIDVDFAKQIFKTKNCHRIRIAASGQFCVLAEPTGWSDSEKMSFSEKISAHEFTYDFPTPSDTQSPSLIPTTQLPSNTYSSNLGISTLCYLLYNAVRGRIF